MAVQFFEQMLGCASIYGDTPIKQREVLLDDFRSESSRTNVLLLSKVGGIATFPSPIDVLTLLAGG